MEIEMKYALPSRQTAESIWEDEYLASLSDAASIENVVMKAVYFDTEDMLLAKNDISVRVRSEGERSIATLKANDSSQGGMFARDELNVPILDGTSFMALDPKIFEGSDAGDKMIDIVKDKTLINILEMHFIRRKKRIAYSSSILELAIDIGEIVTDKGKVPIEEIEIELFAGNEDALRSLGNTIAEKYDLKLKTTSKLKDGLALL